MTPKRFDAFEIEFKGWQVVEASAGTGKTTAITNLFTRCLVEQDLPPEKILVMTFTRDATAELRRRIRDRLVEAREAFAARRSLPDAEAKQLSGAQSAAEPGSFLSSLVQRAYDAGTAETAERRLVNALQLFDEFPIHTIHGFCQRVLTRAGIDVGWTGEVEILPSEGDLQREVAEDFWRAESAQFSQAYAAHLALPGLKTRLTPSRLLEEMKAVLGRPELELRVPPVLPDAERDRLEQAYAEAWRAGQDLWVKEKDSLAELLRKDSGINRGKLRLPRIKGWLEMVEEMLAGDQPRLPAKPADLGKITASALPGLMKKGKSPPSSDFLVSLDPLLECAEAQRGSLDRQNLALRERFVAWMRERLPRRKRELGVRGYDDLLEEVRRALAATEGGSLGRFIREEYKIALIDEFQDTDQRQLNILTAAFDREDAQTPVLMVGDPKQAIYAFRGADVFAYLEARGRAATRWTLRENWRSGPDLITAVNAMFNTVDPFLNERIDFEPVDPAPRTRPDIEWGDPEMAPLELWSLSADAAPSTIANFTDKAKAVVAAARAVAVEIVNLLARGAVNAATIGGRGVSGRDIAVLVRTHAQGETMRRELARVGVGSVRISRDSVFVSPQAEQLERLLRAIAEPTNERRVRAALATPLVGWDVEQIERASSDDRAWAGLIDKLDRLREVWVRLGIGRALWMFLRTTELAIDVESFARLLADRDGERALANFNHLIELLEEQNQRRPGVDELLAWLANSRRHPGGLSDQALLRLESEDNLVRIVTSHACKGLQYGIVYCPFFFVGHGRLSDDDMVQIFHDPTLKFAPRAILGGPKLKQDKQDDEPEASADGAALPGNSGGEPAEEGLEAGFKALVERARLGVLHEKIAEDLRLLYVALTRAQHRCVLVCGAASDTGLSGLAWLLYARADDTSAVKVEFPERWKEIARQHGKGDRSKRPPAAGVVRYASLTALVESLAAKVGGDRPPIKIRNVLESEVSGMAAVSLPPPRLAPLLETCPTIDPARLKQQRSVTSFTALSRGRVADLPDHDARARLVALSSAAQQGGFEFAFPAGARTGKALHGIFEHIDFTQPVGGQIEIVERELAREQLLYGPDKRPWADEVVAWIGRTLETPIHLLTGGAPLRLANIAMDHRINELEFHMSARDVRLDRLNRILAKYGYPELVENSGESFEALLAEGWIKGFIDLVFEADGKHFVVDYKSNKLGDSPGFYGPAELKLAVQREQYTLQYLTYTLAVHRLLGQRIHNYDYERDFGGVFYLFLRGMHPDRGVATGVHFDRPDPALVQALDRLLEGVEG